MVLVLLAASLPAAAQQQQQQKKSYDSFGEWGRGVGEEGRKVGGSVGTFFKSLGDREKWWPGTPRFAMPSADPPPPRGPGAAIQAPPRKP